VFTNYRLFPDILAPCDSDSIKTNHVLHYNSWLAVNIYLMT